MKCFCPKCRAEIELPLSDIPETGTPGSCPVCAARFTVHRESFGARVLRKSGEISCASCGNVLGAHLFCPFCGVQFPDYLVVSLGRKALGRATKKVKLSTSPFPHPQPVKGKLPRQEPTAARDSKPAPQVKAPPKGLGTLPKPVLLALTLVLLATVAFGAVFAYTRHKSSADFTRTFVKATYCMQTGADKSVKLCTRISADWKAKQDAGQIAVPRVNLEEEKDLQTIRKQVESLLLQMQNPPKKYQQAGDQAKRLYTAYLKLSNLALEPPSALNTLVDTTVKLDAEYKTAAREFKAGMPEDLLAELRTASKRYQGLQPLVN